VERRLGPAFLGLVAASVGAALFLYGVLFVENPVAYLGIALAAAGALATVAAAIRARRRTAPGIMAAIAVVPLAFVVWVLWKLAHETT